VYRQGRQQQQQQMISRQRSTGIGTVVNLITGAQGDEADCSVILPLLQVHWLPLVLQSRDNTVPVRLHTQQHSAEQQQQQKKFTRCLDVYYTNAFITRACYMLLPYRMVYRISGVVLGVTSPYPNVANVTMAQ
jgi:hypothetical protein